MHGTSPPSVASRLALAGLGCALALALLTAPSPARGQSEPVVHEFFTYEGGGAPARRDLPPLPEPGATSDARTNAGAPVYTPEGVEAPAPLSDPTLGGQFNGPEAGPDPVRLDRDTAREGLLRYAAVFDPTVAVFKRTGARDAVRDEGGEYVLVTANPEPVAQAIVPVIGPQRARFTATLVIRARAGTPVPIPSVGPGMQVHDVVVQPPVGVSFARDSAENWFVEAAFDGELTLDMVVSAADVAFGGPLPPARTRGAPLAPPRLVADAGPVLSAAGVLPDASDVETVEALVRWFGGFEARPYPADRRSANLYLDLALGRIGVCRHRSQAFVLTALAAGVPARYVFNEAHAFVEVQLGGAWRRVDLGGASDDLEVFADSDAERHEPLPDPLADALPPGAAVDVEGAARVSPSGAAGEPASGGSGGPGAGQQTAGAAQSSSQAGGPLTLGDLPGPAGQRPGPAAPSVPGSPDVFRISTTLTLGALPPNAYRGAAVPVEGRLSDAGGGAPVACFVDIYLGPADSARASAPVQRVGRLSCDSAGAFAGEIVVPATLPVGEWGLYAVFDGDDIYEGARTE